MKSVKEVAETVNVSKTSIYNLIKKHNIPTFKREGKTYLDANGESLVIGYYSTEIHETMSGIVTDTKAEAGREPGLSDFQDKSVNSKLLEYSKVIDILEAERNEKNKVIQGLIQTNKILSQALAADKVNESARLMIDDPSVNAFKRKTSKPIGLFNRVFEKLKSATVNF